MRKHLLLGLALLPLCLGGCSSAENNLPYIKDGYWWVGETNTGLPVNGADGKDGKDGENGQNGINGKDGEKGDKGDSGADGKDGQTPSFTINSNGELIATYPDGTQVNCGVVKEPSEDTFIYEAYCDGSCDIITNHIGRFDDIPFLDDVVDIQTIPMTVNIHTDYSSKAGTFTQNQHCHYIVKRQKANYSIQTIDAHLYANFSILNGEHVVTLKGYGTSDIPEYYQGLRVVDAIWDSSGEADIAFDMIRNNDTFTIPNGYTKIEDNANTTTSNGTYFNFNYLNYTFVIPSTMKEISANAFQYTSALKTIINHSPYFTVEKGKGIATYAETVINDAFSEN